MGAYARSITIAIKNLLYEQLNDDVHNSITEIPEIPQAEEPAMFYVLNWLESSALRSV